MSLPFPFAGQAFDRAPECSGTINGRQFKWIADADSSLGPVMEVILNGRYYWVPFQQISGVTIPQPGDLRDMVWLPAEFTWTNGGQAHGLIPARYAGSESSPDPLIQLGRKTDWVSPPRESIRGLGQKMLVTDVDEYPLLDIRSIKLD